MHPTHNLIQTYYNAFNAKNWQAMLACVADNIHHHVNEGEERGGKEKFAAFIQHMDDCYDESLTDMCIMTCDDGTRAAAEFIVSGTYKKTDGSLPAAHGQTYRLPAGAFFEIADNKITRVTTYYNLNEWIQQVA